MTNIVIFRSAHAQSLAAQPIHRAHSLDTMRDGHHLGQSLGCESSASDLMKGYRLFWGIGNTANSFDPIGRAVPPVRRENSKTIYTVFALSPRVNRPRSDKFAHEPVCRRLFSNCNCGLNLPILYQISLSGQIEAGETFTSEFRGVIGL